MEFDVASYYGYLLILLGLILALYSQIKGIGSPLSKPKDGIPSIKWSQFAWFSFFTLTFMGTIIFFLEPLNILNYRLVYVDTDPGQAIAWIITFGKLINLGTIILDTLLILFCFISLFIGIKIVGMASQQPDAGKFHFHPKNKWQLIIFLLGHYLFLPVLSTFMIIIGGSILLNVLYVSILGPLIYFIRKYGVPY